MKRIMNKAATASDAVDDNNQLTANIVITGAVDTSNLGTYTRRYNVTDSSGNAAVEVTRTIIVLRHRHSCDYLKW